MCGIAGIWNLNSTKLHQETLMRFTDSMTHRGPDGSGYYIDEKANIGLGHRRLSILDLSDAGKQPMHANEGRYTITYNGEVFNFIELRKELIQKGFLFKTETDTEIILCAYQFWGKEAFLKFNGMWAMAIWDSLEQKLILCRDRWGIKPIYYYYSPNKCLAFASETYAFKFLDNVSREIDATNMAFQLENISALEGAGYTIFKNINHILPGHFIEFSKNSSSPSQKRWWNTFENIKAVPDKYEDQVEEFTFLFKDALKLRLRSDVSVATALSGGVDSSSVYCMLHDMMKQNTSSERLPENWQQAFIATFPNTLNDEKIFAEQVVNYTGKPATYIKVDYKDVAQKVYKTTILSDSIIGSPLISSTMIYEEMKKQNISVSMDGHGVDEMMFGYPWLVYALQAQISKTKDFLYAEELKKTYLDLYFEKEKEKIEKNFVKNIYGLKNVSLKLKNKFSQILLQGKNSTSDNWLLTTANINYPELSDKPYQTSHLEIGERLLFESFHINYLPTILRNFDRASMQNSVEVRMPFMDWRLVCFVFSLPVKSKVNNGFTKRILRDAMRGIMPETIRTRKLKIGLNAPMNDWFNNELSEMISDEVNSKQFIESTIWNGKKIAQFASEKTKSKAWTYENSAKFWPYLNAHLISKQ